MPGRWGWAVVVAALGLLVAVGVASAQGGDPRRGGELFAANCAVCHGVDGQGRVGASLENFPGIDPGAAVFDTISHGIDGTVMPAWAQSQGGPLSDQDIADLTAYVLAAFGGTQPITPLPTYVPPEIEPLPEISGDPSLGAAVYHENCVMCHGERGQGRFGVPLAKSWPGTQPAVYIHDVVTKGIAGTRMPAWGQVNGGPLDDVAIQNVVAYVLTLEPASGPTAPPQAEGPLGRTWSIVLLAVIAAAVIVVLVRYYRRA